MSRKARGLLLFTLVGISGAALWAAWSYWGLGPLVKGAYSDPLSERGEADKSLAIAKWPDYETAKKAVAERRQKLSERWQAAGPAEKEGLLREAAAAFSDIVGNQLAPYWYGTPWDFNGTTEIPGEGKIACGYFVCTLMKHAGLQVERVRLSQQASQNIILTLTSAPWMHKGHGMPLAPFVEKIKALGPGVSLVGLDNHVGILWHDGTELWFVHSTVAETRAVIKERASESRVLDNSKYRIVGQITADPELLAAWLTAKPLPTWKQPPRG